MKRVVTLVACGRCMSCCCCFRLVWVESWRVHNTEDQIFCVFFLTSLCWCCAKYLIAKFKWLFNIKCKLCHCLKEFTCKFTYFSIFLFLQKKLENMQTNRIQFLRNLKDEDWVGKENKHALNSRADEKPCGKTGQSRKKSLYKKRKKLKLEKHQVVNRFWKYKKGKQLAVFLPKSKEKI